MLTCDICKREIKRRDIHKQITLPYEYSCSAFQVKEFDLCNDCQKKLNDEIIITKLNFVSKKDKDKKENS